MTIPVFAIFRQKSAVFLAVLLMSFGAFGASSALAGQLLTVRLGGDAVETRLVIDLDKSVSGRLEGEDPTGRHVGLILPGIDAVAVKQGAGQGLVKSWSVSRTPFGVKLNIETMSPTAVKRRFVLPPADGVANYRYVLDLAEVKAPQSAATASNQPVASRPAGLRLASLPSVRRKSAGLFKKTVVIDAGHGGRDPGAHGSDGIEKDVTLASALALKSKLEKSGRYTVS